MRKIFVLSGLFLVAVLSGCVGGPMPTTAADFRDAVLSGKSMMVEHTSFVVHRPYAAVASSYKKYALKCLNASVGITNGINSHTTIIYTPSLTVGSRHLELSVQYHPVGTIEIYKEPKNGYYMLVVDASALRGRRTKVDIYGPKYGHSTMLKAIHNWATGRNMGCPDLAKG